MKRLLFALLACTPALAAAAPSWLLVDGDSQQVFEAHDAEARQPMGGLVSLMVFYTAYKETRGDPAALDRRIAVTEEMNGVLAPDAARCTSKPGETLTVRQALQAIAVNGAQDACLALAQAISEDKKISFVQRMNDNARALRMPSTEYAAPFAQDGQFTTAFDTAKLASAVRKLAGEDFSWFSRQVLLVGDRPVKSTNRALRKHPDITGLLQCEDSRSVVASLHKKPSAQQLPRSVYAVILGGEDDDKNAAHAVALLTQGLQKYETLEIFPPDQTVMTLRVYQGRGKRLPLAAPGGVFASVERERLVSKGMSALSVRFEYMGPVVAPVRKGDRIGVLNVLFDGEKIGSSALHAQRDIVSGSFTGQLIDAVRMRISPPKNIYK